MKIIKPTNWYLEDDVESDCGYSGLYVGPSPINAQVDFLSSEFGLSSELTYEWIEKKLPTLSLPDGSEGCFAIPSLDAVAKRYFPGLNSSMSYPQAVDLVLEKLANSRELNNYHSCKIIERNLRQHVRTLKAFKKISQTQKGDILIIPAQHGVLHRGRSAYSARKHFGVNEFGLGAFAVGCIALTHPERYVDSRQLHSYCVGDELDPYTKGDFPGVPVFSFRKGTLSYHSYSICYSYRFIGSVTGFLL